MRTDQQVQSCQLGYFLLKCLLVVRVWYCIFFMGTSEVPFHGVFYVSLQELTTALEKNPDDAEYYCQRAYAYILLQKYAGNIFRQH